MLRRPPTVPSSVQARRPTYPFGQFFGSTSDEQKMMLLSLSHTPLEDQIYRAMLSEMMQGASPSGIFSVRELRTLTGLNSPSTVRRALNGLLRKLSIQIVRGESSEKQLRGHLYQILKPEEIFHRRSVSGTTPYPKEFDTYEGNEGFERAVKCVALTSSLSRREAQVALACAQGMTNAEIGRKLSICEQTVKFHLRNIFTKFGVKRRAELIYRLLASEPAGRE